VCVLNLQKVYTQRQRKPVTVKSGHTKEKDHQLFLTVAFGGTERRLLVKETFDAVPEIRLTSHIHFLQDLSHKLMQFEK
jgi:hypothetical protein